MFLVFSKFPFLLRWKNVLSSSHALHFPIIRYKSVTHTLISVNRPLIIRCISCKRAFYLLHVRYSCRHCLASTFHTPIVRASSSRIDEFCHRITKFYMFCCFPSVIYPFCRSDQAIKYWISRLALEAAIMSQCDVNSVIFTKLTQNIKTFNES